MSLLWRQSGGPSTTDEERNHDTLQSVLVPELSWGSGLSVNLYIGCMDVLMLTICLFGFYGVLRLVNVLLVLVCLFYFYDAVLKSRGYGMCDNRILCELKSETNAPASHR